MQLTSGHVYAQTFNLKCTQNNGHEMQLKFVHIRKRAINYLTSECILYAILLRIWKIQIRDCE